MNPWLKGFLAGIISGAAQGVLTGYVANGISPGSFNPSTHTANFLMLSGSSALIGAIVGTCTYLAKSPLP